MLMTGRNLYDIAKRSITKHKKAVGFASKLRDLDKKEPIESGTKKADVIEHVRCKMYYYMSKKKKKTEWKKSGYLSNSSDEKSSDVEEDKLMDELQEDVEVNVDNTSTGFVESLEDGPNTNNKETMPPLPNMSVREHSELMENNDDDYVPEAEVVEEEEEDEVSNRGKN